MTVQRMVAGILFSVVCAAGAGQAAPAAAQESVVRPELRRRPVTTQEVWDAVTADLRERGWTEGRLPRVDEVDLPAAVPALAARRLQVSSACWDEMSGRARFRLQCGIPGGCLPFLAYIRAAAGGEEDAGIGLCRRPSWRRARSEPPRPAARPGQRGLAVMVSDGLRMTASVTCLERGREGELIRVRTRDGHVFLARISRVSGQGIALAIP